MEEDRKEVARINVAKKALRIDELENKVAFAISAYKRAADKYQRGTDSTTDWDMVIKALEAEMDELKEFIANAHHNIGVIYAAKEDYIKAADSLRKAVAAKQDYPLAHYNLGVVYKKLNDTSRAKFHYEEAKRLGYVPQKKE